LKPGLIFKGKGLKPVAFKLWVNRVQLAPPHRAASPHVTPLSRESARYTFPSVA
jgi:hypothetical protein